MSIQEIESAISQLQSDELAQLTSWFAQFQQKAWDQQIENDVQSGRIDAAINRANSDFDRLIA